MRYTSIFSVVFHANSADGARSIAAAHHELLRDMLRIEGADHPSEVSLDHIFGDGEGDADVLAATKEKHIQ